MIAIARRYEDAGEPLEDLVQVGAIGLIQAIDRFDPGRGVQLSTYAIPTIEGEIRRHLRDRGGTIRLPRRLQEARSRVMRIREELTARLGRPPTEAELAQASGLPASQVAEAAAAGRARVPLPLPDGSDGSDGTAVAVVDGGLAASEDRVLLADGLAALDDRERKVLHLRFSGGLSQTQIAAEVGLSQAHVSRILRDALAKLRHTFDEPVSERSEAPEPPAAISPRERPISPDQRTNRGAGRGLSPRSRPPTLGQMATPEKTRSLDEYLDLPYRIVLSRDEDADGERSWVARVEELDGCEARGASADDAAGGVRDAMERWIAPALARGRSIPLPRGEATHSGRLLLRMSPALHADLARMADRDDISLNQLITGVLADAASPDGAGGDAPRDGSPAAPGRTWTWMLALNVAVVVLAGIAAVVLLVLAWQS